RGGVDSPLGKEALGGVEQAVAGVVCGSTHAGSLLLFKRMFKSNVRTGSAQGANANEFVKYYF
ncbi:hypothetical protein MK163_16935, partial [bacterium]|nr:hypothetical protein [bacterium]